MNDNRVCHDIDSIRAARELRVRVETLACRQAARQVAAGADCTPLAKSFRRFANAVQEKNHREIYQADMEFHQAILELSNVPGIKEAWHAVHRHEEGFHRETVVSGWPDLAVLLDLHRPILTAIQSADVKGAETTMQSHFDLIWYRLSEHSGKLSIKFDPLTATCAYIATHLREPLRLETLAKRVSRTSASHLARLFRNEHGLSFTAYVRQSRMTRAARLLTTSRMPIYKCAEEVGYNDPSRFAEHFVRHYGMKPSAYRRSHGERRVQTADSRIAR